MELTHRNLCDVAVKWLKRPNSNGGPGSQFAVSEVQSGWQGEIPDAIGFRTEYGYISSSVVEVKVSRSDFLADKKKPHRNGKVQALGNFRYYMCPHDLIKPEELPPKFGLLYVNSRGHVKPVVSPFKSNSWKAQEEHLKLMRFDANQNREMFLMVRLLARLGDPEKLNNELKTLRNFERKGIEKITQLNAENKALSRKNSRLKRKLKAHGIEFEVDKTLDFASTLAALQPDKQFSNSHSTPRWN